MRTMRDPYGRAAEHFFRLRQAREAPRCALKNRFAHWLIRDRSRTYGMHDRAGLRPHVPESPIKRFVWRLGAFDWKSLFLPILDTADQLFHPKP